MLRVAVLLLLLNQFLFPLQEADPNTEMLRLAAKRGFIHRATRQGGQTALWNLPPAGTGLGAQGTKTKRQVVWGAGSPGKGRTRRADRGRRGGPEPPLRSPRELGAGLPGS